MAQSTARAQTATLDPPVDWVRAELHLPHANITVHRTDQPQGSLGSPSVLTTPVHGEVLRGDTSLLTPLYNIILYNNDFCNSPFTSY